MIPKKLTRDDLLGKMCHPVRNIRNGAGSIVTPDTFCKICDVVRGHGFIIQTDPCPCCGQATRITGISRDSLELCEPRAEIADGDIISRSYALKQIEKAIEEAPEGEQKSLKRFRDFLKVLPKATSAEMPTRGHWIDTGYCGVHHLPIVQCPACKDEFEGCMEDLFCPHCGVPIEQEANNG